MWSDIETSKDLLGFKIHANLLKNVVTTEKNLPLTIGLYGDWGSGKSSVLKILKEELDQDENTVVIYFDGWSFESFDDAKMALIQGIVEELEQNEKFTSKCKDKLVGLKEDFKKLKNSINWMRILQISAKSVIPILTASVTNGASLIPLFLEAFKNNKDKLPDLLTGDQAESFLNDIIKDSNDKKYDAIREFRDDFAKLISKSKSSRIVVLIDDLDRCLPRHIIDNLEAIKLFLNVPNTAFVIAADEFIVSSAIRGEYKLLIGDSDNERTNIGNAYMEKFIQLPYRLPVLGRKEVETYITLLFCQSELPENVFGKIRNDFEQFTFTNKFETYGWDNISKIVHGEEYDILTKTTGFLSSLSSIISNALKGNPRLIKRFLNAYEIRSSLLATAKLDSQENRFALLKLMLIEQKYEDLFKQLHEWTFSSNGHPKEVVELEKFADGDKNAEIPKGEWRQSEVLFLLSIEPKFSKLDLRELYWVSRDKLKDVMGGSSLIPIRVKKEFEKAIGASSHNILKNICKNSVKNLSSSDLLDFYGLLDNYILVHPKDNAGYTVYYFCIDASVDMAYDKFINILMRVDIKIVPFSIGNLICDISKKFNDKKLMDLISQNPRLKTAVETSK